MKMMVISEVVITVQVMIITITIIYILIANFHNRSSLVHLSSQTKS